MTTKQRRGFTLVELLVVIGIIAVLISILLPALGKAKQRARLVQCGSNLKNIGNSVMIYANANRGKVPQHPTGGGWLWDMSYQTRDALVAAGNTRDTLYCPDMPDQNVDAAWWFSNGGVAPAPPPAAQPGVGSYSFIGYQWLGQRLENDYKPWSPDRAGSSEPYLRAWVKSIRGPEAPQSTANKAALAGGPRSNLVSPPVTKPAEAELMTDVVVRQGGATAGWSAQGGWMVSPGVQGVHTTPHQVKGNASGANILFLDGHVAFRPYNAAALTNAAARAGDSVIRKRYSFGSPVIDFWF